MKPTFAWTLSVGLLVLGMGLFLGSSSLLRPATNPISEAAPRFQESLLQGTLISVLLIFLSELAARRWSAPAGGWKAGWFLIGVVFLVLGIPLLADTLEEATPLADRTFRFRLKTGGLYLAVGMASWAIGLASRARPKPPV